MRYLKMFETSTAFENFTLDETNTPNVSLIEELLNTTGGVVFTKKILPQLQHDYSLDYFTLVAIDDCYFTFSANAYNEGDGLSYSLDNGETWSEYIDYDDEEPTIHITPGNKVLFKGRNVEFGGSCGSETTFSVAYSDENNNVINTSQRFNVEGNITSLIYGDNFNGQTIIGENDKFAGLFAGNENLVSAENLVLPTNTTPGCYYYMFYGCTSLTTAPVLPATTLTDYCYYGMFDDCTSLTTAPALPATTLANNCYECMFYGCSLLNSITCLAMDISAEYCTNNWLNGVAQTGTFTKASDMTDWTEGEDGIPSGWTVQNAE